MAENFGNCPICSMFCDKIFQVSGMHWARSYDCSRCGRFIVADTSNQAIQRLTADQRSILSNRVRRRQEGQTVIIVADELKTFDLDAPFPNPAEQADNLVLWLGQTQKSVDDVQTPDIQMLSAWIGLPIRSQSVDSPFAWLRDQPEVESLVNFHHSASPTAYSLTMAGWRHYELLKRAQVNSRFAFMAMEFGHSDLNSVVETYFRPAVERTGFTLSLLTHGQTAGNIDAQIQERITASRFMVADLTHRNPGAYWEAGLATGQGKPVFYTCRRAEFDNKISHFDTNHHVTIIWDPDNLEEAGRDLTAKIRNTLPSETIRFGLPEVNS